ncbi:hypothetical protein [Cardiobacterium hominis]|jgi:hypothetical protein|uniref:hypothetical protein n=1 Tax=Cardiobacterium hominis TaxID=2718 RepID=UPI0024937A09|nr:hypothetical protein [Cardiobacterium hominis]
MKTKSHVRFFSRASHLDADIELADVFSLLSKRKLISTTDNYIFDGVDSNKHPILAKRKNNDKSRKNAITHLKATLCEAFIKNIYENLTIYLSEILEAAVRNGFNPVRLIGEHKTSFEANEILSAQKWDNVVSLVAKSVFRNLENERSTKNLIEKINNKLDLKIPENIIKEALPYLEVRHLLVHNNGKLDDKFIKNYRNFEHTNGKDIKLDYQLLQNARKAIYNLVNKIDSQIISLQIVSQKDMQG